VSTHSMNPPKQTIHLADGALHVIVVGKFDNASPAAVARAINVAEYDIHCNTTTTGKREGEAMISNKWNERSKWKMNMRVSNMALPAKSQPCSGL